jgi:23S rRNA pseudouridine1911/1915/1917 synthase
MLWDYLAARRPPQRPFIVHRLDRETSGLLVFAKSPEAKRRLQTQFEARTVERVYVTLVRGRVRDDAGTLRGALAEDEARRVRAVGHATGGRLRRGGASRGSVKEAVTHYRVLERRGDLTLLEILLGTGRRRQIRVQLDALGHPIVGDAERAGHRDRRSRLLLHATRLGFVHPTSGARVRFESPPPGTLRPRGRLRA